jgi:uncharacterized protein
VLPVRSPRCGSGSSVLPPASVLSAERDTTAVGLDGLESRLTALIRSSSMLMRALRAARAVGPPDWLIGGGVIRERVWDHLHGLARPCPSRDVDLAFFDPVSLGSNRERDVQRTVVAQAPDICWDVTNQAAVHLWYPEVFGVELDPLRCSADAVGTWAETATAIGIRLLGDERLEVVAPCGLEDLFGLVCRRNPRLITVEQYRRRVQNQRIARRWPKVRVLDLEEDSP